MKLRTSNLAPIYRVHRAVTSAIAQLSCQMCLESAKYNQYCVVWYSGESPGVRVQCGGDSTTCILTDILASADMMKTAAAAAGSSELQQSYRRAEFNTYDLIGSSDPPDTQPIIASQQHYPDDDTGDGREYLEPDMSFYSRNHLGHYDAVTLTVNYQNDR